MGLEILKHCASYIFHPMSTKFPKDIGYHGGIQASTFLDSWPSFKNVVALEILTWDSIGEPKM